MKIRKLIEDIVPILEEYYAVEEDHRKAKMKRDTKILMVMGEHIYKHWDAHYSGERDRLGRRVGVKKACMEISHALSKRIKMHDGLTTQEILYSAFVLAAELTPMQRKALVQMCLGRAGVIALAGRSDRQKLVEKYSDGERIKEILRNKTGVPKRKPKKRESEPSGYLNIEFNYTLYDLRCGDKDDELSTKLAGLLSHLPDRIINEALDRVGKARAA